MIYITNENRAKFELAMQNLCKLGPKRLLNAMMWDNESDYFLFIFWFSNRPDIGEISFPRTNTLYSLKLPLPFLHT